MTFQGIIGNASTCKDETVNTILMVGAWVGGILCKGDQEPHVILNISDKNGTSKLNKLAIFDKKWNFWNLVAMFDK